MQTERYATRDRSYGIWHRLQSIARFLSPKQAAALTMVDLDSVLFVEYEHFGKIPLCLVEVARDIDQQQKSTGCIRNLARLAGIPAYCVLYSYADHPNPSNPNWPDLEQFRIQRVWPKPEDSWRTLTPKEWASALLKIRGWQLRRFEVQQAANDPNY
jgi:hypothetical protein